MTTTNFHRRTFLHGTALAAFGASALRPVQARAADTDAMQYEVTRSEAEWREMLSDLEYRILREGETEEQGSSDLWDKPPEETGTYCCKGCGLASYDSRMKTVLDKGWAFFHHSEPDAILTDIDPFFPPRDMANAGMGDAPDAAEGASPEEGESQFTQEELRTLERLAAIEVHCRRCGSHLGHLLIVDGPLLHCVNGNAFDFRPREA